MWRTRTVLQLPSQCLLDAGANINAKDSDGNSPLYIASVYEENMLGLFLKYSPDMTVTDSRRGTPLQIATSWADQKSLRIT
jgi:ankyrin repeat protein